MKNPFVHARFTVSVVSLGQLPPDKGIEVAFAGRSNAGKSSAINTITAQKTLARTSKTPGRTREINIFAVDSMRRLVDLPGFGYARAPAAVKRRWQRMLPHYLQSRRSLRGLILVMDIRHPLTEYDLALLHWCEESGMPVHVLLSKSDKLGHGHGASACQQVQAAVAAFGAQVSVQTFSARKHRGVNAARRVLMRWLQLSEAS